MLTGSKSLKIFPLHLDMDIDALIEPGADEAEAIALTIDAIAEATKDFTYSAIAEDNPNAAAGILDGQPGMVYNGPDGNYFRVTADVSLADHGISTPAAGDTAVLAVYKNSEVQAFSDEGFSDHEIAVEHNVDTVVGPYNEGDVLRFGVAFNGEADSDVTNAAAGLVTVL